MFHKEKSLLMGKLIKTNANANRLEIDGKTQLSP